MPILGGVSTLIFRSRECTALAALAALARRRLAFRAAGCIDTVKQEGVPENKMRQREVKVGEFDVPGLFVNT